MREIKFRAYDKITNAFIYSDQVTGGMRNKILLIEWLDSKGVTHEWEYLDEIESMKPTKCWSVGFLLEQTKEYKTIVQSVSDTQVVGRMTIPCCSIQTIKEVKV